MTRRPAFVAPPVYAREQAHLRVVHAAVLLLLLSSASPLIGPHLAAPVTEMLVGRDHLLNICLVALHQLLSPVHLLFHWLVGAGLAYAIFDRMRAVSRLHDTLELLSPAPVRPDSAISRAAVAAGVHPGCIRVVSGNSAPAFTAGLLTPLIFIDVSVPRLLSAGELAAVIAHEDAHRRRRDPLRLTAWRFLACMLFFLPVLRRLEQDMADEAEVAADDDAVATARVEPLTLAAALVVIASQFPGSSARIAAPAFHRDDILGRRVRRLAGEDTPVGTHLTRRSAAGAAVALAAVWLSGLIVTHPLPPEAPVMHVASHASAPDPSHHCTHEDGGPLRHLFCMGWPASPAARGASVPHAAGASCPHAAG